jgi:hypothetical protein
MADLIFGLVWLIVGGWYAFWAGRKLNREAPKPEKETRS